MKVNKWNSFSRWLAIFESSNSTTIRRTAKSAGFLLALVYDKLVQINTTCNKLKWCIRPQGINAQLINLTGQCRGWSELLPGRANSLISLRGTDCVSICEMHSHTRTPAHTHISLNLYVYLCINKTQNVLISRRSRLFHMLSTYFTLFMQFVVRPPRLNTPYKISFFLGGEWEFAEVS